MSANWSISCWVTSRHSLGPMVWPTRPLSSSIPFTVMVMPRSLPPPRPPRPMDLGRRRRRATPTEQLPWPSRRGVLAVVAVAESAAILVGHSFGAVCALEAARRAPGLRALVLYEGGPCDGRVMIPAGAADLIAGDLARGDRDAALSDMLLRAVQLSPRQVAHARRDPTWAEHLANVDAVARELSARRELTIDTSELHDIHTPVLLLVGSRSPPAMQEATAALARGLPHAHVVTLEGQGHSAMHSNPALFVAALLEFTGAIEPPRAG